MTNRDIEFTGFEAKLREQIAKDIEELLCTGPSGCWGVNKEHCDNIKECIDIVRKNK